MYAELALHIVTAAGIIDIALQRTTIAKTTINQKFCKKSKIEDHGN